MPFLAMLAGLRSNLTMLALGAAALLVVSTGSYALVQRSTARSAETARAAAVASLTASEAARKAETENHLKAVAALESRAAAAETRAVQTNTIRQEVRRAPSTNVCSTSPAMRKLLDGVRANQPARPAAPAQRSRQPASVPR